MTDLRGSIASPKLQFTSGRLKGVFVSQTWLMYAIGLALCIGLYIWRR